MAHNESMSCLQALAEVRLTATQLLTTQYFGISGPHQAGPVCATAVSTTDAFTDTASAATALFHLWAVTGADGSIANADGACKLGWVCPTQSPFGEKCVADYRASCFRQEHVCSMSASDTSRCVTSLTPRSPIWPHITPSARSPETTSDDLKPPFTRAITAKVQHKET